MLHIEAAVKGRVSVKEAVLTCMARVSSTTAQA